MLRRSAPRALGVSLVAASVLLAFAWLLGATAQTLHAADTVYRTFRPDGPGRHPAVIFVSGCDGFAPSLAPTVYERRAEYFRSRGFTVVFLDYLGRRGLKTCAGAITHQEAARDLLTAAVALRSDGAVDPSRIAAIGWSYGGRAVLVAVAEKTDKTSALSRAVVYYPDCRALAPWTATVPLLMLLGGDDDMTPAKLCQDAVDRAAAPTTVKIVVYPGAVHAFDVAELPRRTKLGFASIGHDPAATAAARDEVDRFLSPAR
jgi:dienelactone hydrolase